MRFSECSTVEAKPIVKVTHTDDRSNVAEAGNGSDSNGTDSIGRSVRSGPTEYDTGNTQAEISGKPMNLLNNDTYGPYP